MSKNGAVIVRPETSADYEQIPALVTVAMRSNEAELVELIRESDNYIPELALVAEQAERIVGPRPSDDPHRPIGDSNQTFGIEIEMGQVVGWCVGTCLMAARRLQAYRLWVSRTRVRVVALVPLG